MVTTFFPGLLRARVVKRRGVIGQRVVEKHASSRQSPQMAHVGRSPVVESSGQRLCRLFTWLLPNSDSSIGGRIHVPCCRDAVASVVDMSTEERPTLFVMTGQCLLLPGAAKPVATSGICSTRTAVAAHAPAIELLRGAPLPPPPPQRVSSSLCDCDCPQDDSGRQEGGSTRSQCTKAHSPRVTRHPLSSSLTLLSL